MAESEYSLHIELFGGLRVHQDDGAPVEFTAQQSSALLALLALNLGRTYTRDEIIEHLWPEDDVDSARKKLRHALYILRRQFEQPPFENAAFLQTARSSLGLAPGSVRTD